MEALAKDLLIDNDDPNQIYEPVGYDFAPAVSSLSRRTFVQVLGAGLLIAAASPMAVAQERPAQGRGGSADRRSGGGGGGGRGQGRPIPIDARLHLGKDGTITVLCGKVEGGQGARGQITQAAAEELRVPVERIKLVLADTSLTPDDGGTSGSRTTPSTLPAVRQACAAARRLLEDFRTRENKPEATYADLAGAGEAAAAGFKQPAPRDAELVPPGEWKVLGESVARPNARDLVTGAHQFPSDIIRDGMLYAKVLRPPTYGATLTSIDLEPAKAMADAGVVAVHDKDFVAVAAPTTHLAKKALAEIAKTAKWASPPHPSHPSSTELNDYLRKHSSDVNAMSNPHAAQLDAARTRLKANYNIPYVQHAPMEPRAAVAEWADGGNVTVWTATQNPFRVRGEIAQAFHLDNEQVRVIIPDFGGGFGGKHTGECAVEAARIARAAQKPVALRWTRAEEFTWAYFRPAAVMEMEAGLDADGKLSSWHFININSGRSGIETPYRVRGVGGAGKAINETYIQSEPPLRHGSYRALAAVANHFGRECFMDELARAIGRDPLEFRTAQLEPGRLRDVLVEAAMKFDWPNRWKTRRSENVGIGLACGTEKGSFVATCAEVEVDRPAATFRIRKICQAYECGAITSPVNLRQQVLGGILQALGPVLREASEFAAGKITNASFWKYQVPRFSDVPPAVDVYLIDRPDLPSVGAGETPLITLAPAIANAIFDACGVRLRDLPLKLPAGA
jgi:isoquinoline 1-oxidoreductase